MLVDFPNALGTYQGSWCHIIERYTHEDFLLLPKSWANHLGNEPSLHSMQQIRFLKDINVLLLKI